MCVHAGVRWCECSGFVQLQYSGKSILSAAQTVDSQLHGETESSRGRLGVCGRTMAKPKKRKFNLRKREDVVVRAKDGFQLLVNEVKKHPVLYNPFHDGYSDPKRKRNAWLHISKELLQYTRNNSLTKIRTSWAAGVAILQRKLKEQPKKPWKYMEDMQFLVPFLDAKVKRKDILRKFNENKVARLIQEVKKYPHLYNPSHFSYNSHKVKRMTWIKIGEILGCTNERAKYLWKKALQHFREGMNQKGEENVESSKPPIEEWVHYKSMEFMKSFVTKKSQLIYKDRQDARKNKIVRLIKAVEEHPVLYNPHCSKSKSHIVKRRAWSIIGQKLQHPSTELRTIWHGLKAQLRCNPSPSFTFYKHMEFVIPFLGTDKATEGSALDSDEDTLSMAISEENAYMHKNKMEYEDESLQSDHIYNFFMSAYNATEKMPKALQLRMKKKIFEAVTDAEELLWEASLIRSPTQS